MLRRFNLANVSFVFLWLALLVIPINYDVFSVRLSDLLILFSFALILFTKVNERAFSVFAVFLLVLLALMASQLVGLFYAENFRSEGVVFYFKWLMIFISIFLLYSHLWDRHEDIVRLSRILFYLFVFLSAWVYIYLYLVASGAITGNIRVSFPLSRDYSYPDAHLYSSLLSMLIFSYHFVLRKVLRHSFVFSLAVIFFSIPALFLTGSRGGLLMLILGASIVSVYFLLSGDFFYKKIKLKNVFLILPILVFVAGYGIQAVDFSDDYIEVFDRAINFNLDSDQSSISRVNKLQVALDEISNSYLILGVGPLSAKMDWYDGVISILLSHGGFLLLSIVLIILLYFLYFLMTIKASTYNKFIIFSMFLMYLLSNVITEYVFVTRNFFPVFVSFAIAIAYAKREFLNRGKYFSI
ncbi:MAG: hypothetical protein IBX55_24015 [Methyloprofundus sp.]|nr:hypothetical protein [Methyloprofundus sp.]